MLVFLLFLIAAILFGIEAVFHKSIVAAGLCLMAVAFTIGAWTNVN